MSREACFNALFVLLSELKAAGTVKTCDRRVKLITEVKTPELPALYLAGASGTVQATEGMPPIRTLGAIVYLYAANTDPHTTAGTVLNGLIDAVEAALDPGWEEVQTLGGLVSHCWIEGTIEVFEGPLGQHAAAIIPVKILMP